MEIGICPEHLKENGICPAYYYKLFYDYPSKITPEVDQYLDTIQTYSDPILKYVALYLIHNYTQVKEYFTNDRNFHNDMYCSNLNRWLDHNKSFYTYSEKSPANVTLWKIYIEELWNKLHSNNKGNICRRMKIFSNTTEIPEELKKDVTNYVKYPEDFICYDPSNTDSTIIEKNCDALNKLCSECKHLTYYDQHSDSTLYTCSTDGISSSIQELQMLSSCKVCPSLIKTVALPSCYTISVTLFFALFLYKFTPFGSKLSNRGRKKKRLQQQFMEEMAYAEYNIPINNNMLSTNQRNHLLYQSMPN
ncbi:VIR protein [Plasmodium vivax]|uniref:VIR protein n=1 Tax=Plasmodium vivax TaxID=5855 RepID=A0A1G4GWX9_PLAVI|nr:VIR protein [Plasmodium vivax]